MTEHSATPPQVAFPDQPVTEHDLVEWAAKILKEFPAGIGMSEHPMNHQRHLWLKSYEIQKEQAREANKLLKMDENHERVVGYVYFGEGDGFIHSHGYYAMHSHDKEHPL